MITTTNYPIVVDISLFFLFQVLPRDQTITSIQWVGDHQVAAIGTDLGDVRLVDGQESRLVCV